MVARTNILRMLFSCWKKVLFLFFGLVVLLPARSQEIIIVENNITTNTTWISGNTYIIANNIEITPSRTLTIEPGVSVLFNIGTRLSVYGTLFAQGAVNDSIVFAPNYEFPGQIWQWIEIRFQSISKNNLIQYAILERAQNAVIMQAGSQIEVFNSTFKESQLGIKLEGELCEVKSSAFTNNVEGVYITGSNNIVGTNVFENNDYAISIERPGSLCRSNLVEDNIITGSFIGIQIGRSGFLNSFGSNKISRNIFYHNHPTALVIYQDSTLVTNNIFWENHHAITLLKAKQSQILNNSFNENHTGIRFGRIDNASASQNTFNYNTISRNVDSMIVFRSAPQKEIQNNNLFPASFGDQSVYNLANQNVTAVNNWWGIAEVDSVNQLIFDHHDDPAFGEVFFEPFLSEPDTVAPISPPVNAFKQSIDGKIIVSWDGNPEADVAGYRVYFGFFNNYSFSKSMDLGGATQVELPDVSFDDMIAVTAYDHQGIEPGMQLEGHESVFSFTRKAPYAGPDTLACKNNGAFRIQSATVYDHDELRWTSSGDGNFDDVSLLHPTYYPGIADLESGSVLLTITVVAENDVQSDSFLLEFLPDPVAYAGNDSIIYPDSSYYLSEATAAYYQFVLWLSSGDGKFDNPNLLNTYYTPGSDDLIAGSVQLFLIAESMCGATVDTLTLTIEQYLSVQGRVHAGNLPMANGVVIAYIDYQQQFKAVKLTSVDQAGEFSFPELFKGNYYLYAVPGGLYENDFLPGYYYTGLIWPDAYLLPLYGNVFDIDLRLPPRPESFPVGNGRISGYFLNADPDLIEWDIYGRDWFHNPSFEPDPLDFAAQNLSVLLFNPDMDIPLNFTLTDEDGFFEFDGLPYGNYRVSIEKAGFISIPSPVITLDQENPSKEGLEVAIEPKMITVKFRKSEIGTNDISVFPNPAKGKINIEYGLQQQGIYAIEIYNAFMQQVMEAKPYHHSSQGKVNIEIFIDNLPSGAYFGIIINMHGETQLFTFLKE
jgi:hypothetical protein